MRGLAFLLAFFVAGAASARTVLSIPTDPEARIHIQVESCFGALPSSGYLPVEVTINNSSNRPHTWNLQFASPGMNMYGSAQIAEQMRYETSVTVESGAARTFKLLAPLATSEGNDSGLVVSVSGYGLTDLATQYFPTSARSGNPPTACMAVTDGASAALGKRLEDAAHANSQQLHEVKCAAAELPDEWRALSGLAGLWIMDGEWTALSAPQRTAVEDWIAIGGELIICAKVPPAPLRRIGLGSIVSMDLGSLDHGPKSLQAILKDSYAASARATREETAAHGHWSTLLRGDVPGIMTDDPAHWTLANEIGLLKPNLPLLISFLAVFATTVGPVNLFVFASKGRRSRLFWTVPVISLAATCLLLILIVVQDGFGGWGSRSALICLVPSARKAVIVQEQITRTGVLGSGSFSIRDPAWMTLVSIGGGAYSYRGYHDTRVVENSDTHFAGEWFKSRSIQAQWIESVVPTRAEVALVNPEETRDGQTPPVIVSSIAAPLRSFWFWDSKGRQWGAVNVRTGVKTVLSPGTAAKNLFADTREVMARRAAAMEKAPGNFLAVSGDDTAFIATLPSIRWKDRQAIYVGPVTGAETLK